MLTHCGCLHRLINITHAIALFHHHQRIGKCIPVRAAVQVQGRARVGSNCCCCCCCRGDWVSWRQGLPVELGHRWVVQRSQGRALDARVPVPTHRAAPVVVVTEQLPLADTDQVVPAYQGAVLRRRHGPSMHSHHTARSVVRRASPWRDHGTDISATSPSSRLGLGEAAGRELLVRHDVSVPRLGVVA